MSCKLESTSTPRGRAGLLSFASFCLPRSLRMSVAMVSVLGGNHVFDATKCCSSIHFKGMKKAK